MTSLRSSGEHSIQSQHSPKTSLSNKNDPNLALYEAQPSKSRSIHSTWQLLTVAAAVNNQPGSQDALSLRNVQHRDRDGHIISE